MELSLKVAGVILILLALIHTGFPRYFKWRDAFASLGALDRQMIYVHTFFVALMVLLNGLLCLFNSGELVHTHMGRGVCFFLAIFWTARLFCQLFIYSSSHWRGKTFETIIHLLFTVIWIYLAVVFWWVAIEGVTPGAVLD